MNGWFLIGLLLLLLLLAFCIGCFYLAAVVAKPKFFTIERAKEIEIESGVYGNFDDLPKQDYIISSFDGYQMRATLIPAEKETKQYVIITHGYGYNRMGSVKYVHLFRSLGYNAVIYDSRGHGDNARTINTMGKIEHRDLLTVIKDTRKRYGADIEIGLHGESMGSALSVMALGAKPDVKFLVSDCGYAELGKILSDQLTKQYHLPAFLIHPISLASKLRFGYFYKEVIPWHALVDNQIPVLFIHGKSDTFILPEHCAMLYDHDAGYKEMLLVEGAEHAKSYFTDPAAYTAAVKKFLDTIRTK